MHLHHMIFQRPSGNVWRTYAVWATLVWCVGSTGCHRPSGRAAGPDPESARESGRSGTLFLGGGGLGAPRSSNPVWAALAARMPARRGAGLRMAVLPAAHADPVESFGDISAGFATLVGGGAVAEVLPLSAHVPGSGDDHALAGRIAAADSAWFVGGDQTRLLNVVAGTRGAASPTSAALRMILTRGGLVGGTSAGAAAAGAVMFTGGGSADALESGRVRLAPGLGLFPYGLVDTHVLARGRLGRLAMALPRSGTRFGYGVAEGCALSVDLAGGRVDAVGSGTLLLIDSRDAEVTSRGVAGSRLSLLGPGDHADGATGVVVPGNDAEVQGETFDKHQTPQGPGNIARYPVDRGKLWDDEGYLAIVTALRHLADRKSRIAEIRETSGGTLLRISFDESARSWRRPGCPDLEPCFDRLGFDIMTDPPAAGSP